MITEKSKLPGVISIPVHFEGVSKSYAVDFALDFKKSAENEGVYTRNPIVIDFQESSNICFEMTNVFENDPKGFERYQNAFVQSLQDTVNEWGGKLSNEDDQPICVSTLDV